MCECGSRQIPRLILHKRKLNNNDCFHIYDGLNYIVQQSELFKKLKVNLDFFHLGRISPSLNFITY